MPPKKSKLKTIVASIAKIFKKKASLNEVEVEELSEDAIVPISPQVKSGKDEIAIYD